VIELKLSVKEASWLKALVQNGIYENETEEYAHMRNAFWEGLPSIDKLQELADLEV
jgi:hypothetical protein